VEPLPPPPPPRPDLSAREAHGFDTLAERSRIRPQPVTAAGVILIALGAIQAVAGLILVAVRPDDLARIGSFGNIDIERLARGVGVIALAIGSVGVLAGILVLRLVEGGRILGLVLSIFLVLSGVASIANGNGVALVSMGLYGFVVYALFAHASAFRRAGQG
jgi:hypothetical protein